MKIGLLLPQGWKSEYAGLSPEVAWATTARLAGQADRLGFESVWLFDHFHTVPEPAEEVSFEALSSLAALAATTRRVRLGTLVACAGFRNPALLAKMAGTIDTISGGRFELGIGAGWKEDEWLAYGYGFPSLHERLDALGEALEVLRRMLGPGRATFEGRHLRVRGAINVPRGLQQPRVPILVGGNGRNVTWRLAARFADELNLVFLAPDEVREDLPIVRERCLEEGRDPASLRVSLYLRDQDVQEAGPARSDLLAELASLGLDRVVAFVNRRSQAPEVQEAFAEDVRAAGLELAPPEPETWGGPEPEEAVAGVR